MQQTVREIQEVTYETPPGLLALIIIIVDDGNGEEGIETVHHIRVKGRVCLCVSGLLQTTQSTAISQLVNVNNLHFI